MLPSHSLSNFKHDSYTDDFIPLPVPTWVQPLRFIGLHVMNTPASVYGLSPPPHGGSPDDSRYGLHALFPSRWRCSHLRAAST
ncbi:unnamed protein product [Vitrella brassicaformis CCMP3155]|uniref:Uncharacterized protein n=1 Tax=Vitrella brassicaformis (strain CCMP3155) TaxID=1169540 RepID=A0A0G4EG09_VITBC|nr:unnamed protein product [Vitrella brassicaformis CCMP3155]|eukprot:CEL94320.1 unnamed protein product [Vitrella brassicaformis CCMP3155]